MDLDLPFSYQRIQPKTIFKTCRYRLPGMLLGTVCTSLAYVAGVSVMRELSAFRVALITNLEPVYGIIMAFIFLVI
jgi:drug/metabolite transporter (DMT)-like permease